ncbi:MAG TPA: O-antigen ligase family protein [Terriglobales bacterium]|nr:O-antigen ligase family protein [Terriglobales bacterium]
MSKFKPSRRLATAASNFPALKILTPKERARANAFGGSHDTSTLSLEPPALSEALQSQIGNPTRQFAFKCTLIFLFFRFSFLHEYLSAKLNFDTHLLVIFGGISYFAAFLAGDFFGAFRERATWMWCGFAACMTLATAASIWRGGSLATLLPYLRTTLPFIFLIPAVAYTRDELQKIINIIGFAGVTTTMLGLFSSDFKTGRLAFGSVGSTIQDSNDYAAHMILLLPAMAYLFFGPKRNMVFKIIGGPVLALGLYQIFSTGSRGGLVGLMITGLYILKKGTPKIRAAILIAVPAATLLIFTVVPQESAQRLRSLFDSSDATQEAAESKAARTFLFWASVHATLSHPILGVGPAVFMDYQAGVASGKGQKGMWHDTHNGYTQVSSECGIPALLFYLAAIGMTYISLRKASRSGVPIVSTLGSILSVMMVGYCVCIVFLSQGYNFNLPVITGITTSINRLLPGGDAAGVDDSSGARI